MTSTKDTVERMRRPQQTLSAAASLEHLTGGARGMVLWLHGNTVAVRVGPNTTIRITLIGATGAPPDTVATLHRSDAGYVINAISDEPVWVNGTMVDVRPLMNGDLIEFGDDGPLSRFHLHRDGACDRHDVSEILGDALDYVRVSRQPIATRLWRAVGNVLRRLTRETTMLFRTGVVIAIIALIGVTSYQAHLNQKLETALQAGDARMQQIAARLMRTQAQALSNQDLVQLRQELSDRLQTQQNRLAALERAPDAIRTNIAAATPSVAFLQGAYGFRERTSGQMLRYVLGATSVPILSPFGQPMLSVEGDGPIAQMQFIGTGFALEGTNVIVTNRHVALPWESEDGVALSGRDALEPVVLRFLAYFPGSPDPMDVETLRVSDEADLALLKPINGTDIDISGLRLSDRAPRVGDDIVVMGFPTGLRAMLAQSGDDFVEELQNEGVTDFWDIATRLSNAGYIAPLASRGIVGQATLSTLVYDADTTLGGSGGPVLDKEGNVLAINAAILPEYGGSNLGVPVRWLRTLLDADPSAAQLVK